MSENYYISSLEDNTVWVGAGVAKVGDTLYSTLQSAINAASSGNTVTLLASVNEGSDSEITFNSPVIVNTSSDVDNNSSMIRNYGGTMTITDGTFTSDSLSCIKNEPNSTLTISGGTITNKAESASKKQGAIINAGTVTVSGGTINSYTGIPTDSSESC